MRVVAFSVAWLFGLMAAAPLAAQRATEDGAGAPAGERRELEAVELFEIGERAYKAREYDKAVRYMQEALKLHFNPTLVYNLARAHQKAGQLPEAIEAYRRYLEAEPAAQDREQVQARIEMLQNEVTERDALRARRAEQPMRRGEDESGGRVLVREPDPIPWVVAGASAAALGVGVILSALALEKHGDADESRVQATAYQLQNEAEELAVAANVTFTVGGILLAAGVVWGLIDVTGEDESESGSIRAALGPGGLVVSGVLP